MPGPLVWTLPEPPGRTTTTTLDRAKITRAALGIADAEGADAITMRRISTELGSSTPMSLYRYVGSKDGLVDLMIDAVYGEIELPAAPGDDWRADLEQLSLRTWSAIQRHLWFGELVHTRPPFGPNALRHIDFRFAVLERLGLDADTMSRLTAAIDGHLIGSALQLAEENRMRRRSGLATAEQLGAVADSVLEPIVEAGRHPAFSRWLRARTPADPTDHVEWTLGCLLDGIAARLDLPPSGSAGDPR
jgi:AcrR family transcriptional regulator